jgi:hypothetical protein
MAGYLASKTRGQREDETDLIGPLHLLVVGGLIWMAWVAIKAERDRAAAPLPGGP